MSIIVGSSSAPIGSPPKPEFATANQSLDTFEGGVPLRCRGTVTLLFGTLVTEAVLASVHVRAHKQAGHMDASDLIKALQNTLQGGGRPHMENRRASRRILA